MIALRLAEPADLEAVFPRTRALNDHEGIAITDDALAAALLHLLHTPVLGGIWIIERAGITVGYAMVTFGYDLEFGGRDAWLTELWIDAVARGDGTGAAALALLEAQLVVHDVRALHLQVRPDNPAKRLYERAGYEASPRVIMTRRLGVGH